VRLYRLLLPHAQFSKAFECGRVLAAGVSDSALPAVGAIVDLRLIYFIITVPHT
jgi:hypothetical protein